MPLVKEAILGRLPVNGIFDTWVGHVLTIG
jgi:hypothetical protein